MSITARPDWMTLSDIRDEVDSMVRDNSLTDANLNAYINKAYKWMFGDQLWPTRKTTGTVTMVDGTSEYELPSDCSILFHASSGNNTYLIQNEADNLLEFGPVSSNAGYKRAVVDGYMIRIQPTPGSEEDGNDFNLNYYQTLFVYDTNGDKVNGGLVNDTDYPALPGNMHQLLADKAALITMSYNREDGNPPIIMNNTFKEEYAKEVFMTVQKPVYPNVIRIRR